MPLLNRVQEQQGRFLTKRMENCKKWELSILTRGIWKSSCSTWIHWIERILQYNYHAGMILRGCAPPSETRRTVQSMDRINGYPRTRKQQSFDQEPEALWSSRTWSLESSERIQLVESEQPTRLTWGHVSGETARMLVKRTLFNY